MKQLIFFFCLIINTKIQTGEKQQHSSYATIITKNRYLQRTFAGLQKISPVNHC